MTEKGKPRRARRTLSGEERELWGTVTRSVAPLPGRRRMDAAPVPDSDSAVATERAAASAAAGRPPSASPASLRAPPKPAPSPLAPLGRKLAKRVARGSTALDARLDLHGMTQQEAHHALLRFVRSAQADGARLVLVITGKGARGAATDGGGERGVLRRQVPHWLRLTQFRAYVLGFETAHGAHGGDGAFYVRLRRPSR